MVVSKYDVQLDLAGAPDTSHAYMVDLVGSNKCVLDVGCATGYLAKALTAFGNRVCGVEYDAAAAEQARPYLDKVMVADLETADLVAGFGEGSFDVVMFGDVLEHLRDPLLVLRKARPLLKPGGSVVVSVPNVAHGDVRLALLRGKFEYRNLGLLDETHVRFFTRESLGRFMADGGFVMVDVRRTAAALFSTEIGVRREDFDPKVVEEVEADPEATTYQFVVRAVRDDALRVEAELLERVEQQSLRIRELERQIERLTEERDSSVAQADDSRADRESLMEQVMQMQDELHRIQHSTLMRAARAPRAVWAKFNR